MSDFKVVLIANDDDHPVPDWVPGVFADAGVAYDHHECHGRQDLEECASDADVLWLMSSRKGLVVEENMDVFVRAGAIIKCGSGTDNIDHEACTRRGIIVAHTPDVATEPTSDHIVAMLLTAVRRTAVQDALVRKNIWNPAAAEAIALLSGAELGVVGFGRIGQAVVRKLSGFRMDVRVHDPYVVDVIEAMGAKNVDIEELLRESQFVIVACPLTNETKGLIGERELAMMRPDAVLVNCARAGIVDEGALVKALGEKRIAAAALDVLEKQPPDPKDEILLLDNLNITPHIAGNANGHAERVFRVTVDVIVDMSKMKKPRWIVNRGVVPRWKMTQQ